MAMLGLIAGSVLAVHACGGDSTAPESTNTKPVADAGADLAVSANLGVALDGSGSSDGDGDPLTYDWSFASMPTGSQSALDDATAEAPSFTPDVAGDYVVELVVNDGTDESAPDRVTVSAADNTATETVGSAGGTVTSADGNLTLVIPAGALTTDEEISVTMVPPAQRDPELSDLTADAAVYDMQPDGLQFSTPAEVSVSLPGVAPTVADTLIGITPAVITSRSGGNVDLADTQLTTAELDGQGIVASGEISHFSVIVADMLRIGTGASAAALKVEAGFFEESYPVGQEWPVAVRVRGQDDLPKGSAKASWADASVAPVSQKTNDTPDLEQNPVLDILDLLGSGTYTCDAVGLGSWAGVFGVSVDASLLGPEGVTGSGLRIFSTKVSHAVQCVQPQRPFTDFDLPSPEGISMIQGVTLPDGYLFTHGGGASVTNDAGEMLATYDVSALTSSGLFTSAGLASDGVMVGGTDGLFAHEGEVPLVDPAPMTPPSYTMTRLPQPASGPDLTSRVTDLLAWATTTARVVAVLFGSRDLAFFSSGSAGGGSPGFLLDQSLATAFNPPAGNVFGMDRPVTAYMGPNGFTENDPMLVATVADDGSGASKLLRASLVGGVAVLTEVTGITPGTEVRRVRCLLAVCVLSNYGGAFGGGGVAIFVWQGGTTVTPATGGAFTLTRAVGVDMVTAGPSSVMIAAVDPVGAAFAVYEVSLDGHFLSSNILSVPDGCTQPDFIHFRGAVTDGHGQVIVSCFDSGTTASSDF